jgi:hypothetical protein
MALSPTLWRFHRNGFLGTRRGVDICGAAGTALVKRENPDLLLLLD